MRIKISPTFLSYLFFVACTVSVQACAAMVAALAVHEFSHYGVARALGEPLERIELAPFGGVMRYAPGRSASKGLRGVLIAAAGPAGNYALIVLTGPLSGVLGEALSRQMIYANLSMLVINLLPALPLDGGSILFSLGYFWFGVARMVRVLCALGVLFGVGLVLTALYGVMQLGTANVTLLIAGVYLMVCAFKSRSVMLSQNVYTVIHERMAREDGLRRVTLYALPQETPVIGTLPCLARSDYAMFVIDGNPRQLIDERTICQILLKDPQSILDQAGLKDTNF